MATNPTDKVDQEPVEPSKPTEQPPKKRGRQPSNKAPTSKKEKLSKTQLQGMLYIGHATLANAMNKPIIAIEPDEAGQIAEALVELLQFYDFEVSAKSIAWANLIGVLATVYGFKILSVLKPPVTAPTVEQAESAIDELIG